MQNFYAAPKKLAASADRRFAGNGSFAAVSLVVTIAVLAFVRKTTGVVFGATATRSVPTVTRLRARLLGGGTDRAERSSLGALRAGH
jgi:hypothetical protein